MTSPDVATGQLDRAIDLMDPADPGRDRLLAERAGSLMLAGRVPDALAICRQLNGRHHDPDTDGPVRICLAHAPLAQGQVHDALHELEEASQSPSLTGAEQAAARAWAGFARISVGDLDGAAAAAKQARASSSVAADHLTTSVIMSTMVAFKSERADGQALPGMLTVSGVTRPVSVMVEQIAVTPKGFTARGTARIDRAGFGVTAYRGLAGRHLDTTVEIRCVRN